MDYKKITLEYYSKWLDVDFSTMKKAGVFFNKTAERDKKLAGYSEIYDLYVFIQADKVIVSYGEKAARLIGELQKKLKEVTPIKEIKSLLERVYGVKPKHEIKYFFTTLNENAAPAARLTSKDCDSFLQFFKSANYEYEYTQTDNGWIKDYFNEFSKRELAYAVMEDSKIVCATEVPPLPYMHNSVAELGINTLREYRGKGYAKAACTACIKAMIEKNICPLWSATANNIASQKLAKSIGFNCFADVLMVTI